MSISFSGLASGLDTTSWVTSLTQLRQAKVVKYEEQKQEVVAAQSTLQSIRSIFTSFRASLEKITDSKFKVSNMDIFSKKLAAVSNAAILSATAKSNAAEGSYSVKVNNIATQTKVKSGYRYKTTLVSTTQATTSSSLKDVGIGYGTNPEQGITAGDIEIDHNDVTSRISISEDETMSSFLGKLHDAGINAEFDNATGIFSIDVNVGDIRDIGNTNILNKLKISDINYGYTGDQLKIEGSHEEYHQAESTTLLSDLGVSVGTISISTANGDYEVTLDENDTIGSLVSALRSEGIEATFNEGIFSITNANITNDGTTGLIEHFGLTTPDIASQTQSSDGLTYQTVYSETTTAQLNSYLKDIDGVTLESNQTIKVKNADGVLSTITVGTTTKISDMLAMLNDEDVGLNVTYNESTGVLSINDGWIVAGGTFDVEAAFGLEYTGVPATVTGSALTVTTTTVSGATSSTKLKDLTTAVTSGTVEVTDTTDTVHNLVIDENSTIGELVSQIRGLGLGADFDNTTGVLTLTGGSYTTDGVSNASNFLNVFFGSDTLTPNAIDSATSVSQSLREGVITTHVAEGTTTLNQLGLSEGTFTATFTTGLTEAEIEIDGSMTMSGLVSALRAAGVDAGFDAGTSKLVLTDAVFTGVTGGNFDTIMNFTETITGRYVTSDSVTSQTVTIGKEMTSAGVVYHTIYTTSTVSTTVTETSPVVTTSGLLGYQSVITAQTAGTTTTIGQTVTGSTIYTYATTGIAQTGSLSYTSIVITPGTTTTVGQTVTGLTLTYTNPITTTTVGQTVTGATIYTYATNGVSQTSSLTCTTPITTTTVGQTVTGTTIYTDATTGAAQTSTLLYTSPITTTTVGQTVTGSTIYTYTTTAAQQTSTLAYTSVNIVPGTTTTVGQTVTGNTMYTAGGVTTATAETTLAELGMTGVTGTIVTDNWTYTVSATDTLQNVMDMLDGTHYAPDWFTAVQELNGTKGGVSLENLAAANGGFINEVSTIAPEITVVNAADLASALSTYTTIGIGSSEALAELAKIVNGMDVYSANNCEGKTIVLTTDLDISTICADQTNGVGVGGWYAIGSSAEKSFNGTFDGNGHTVSGLYIKCNRNNVGLFGYVQDGEIRNLGVEGEITGLSRVGLLAGYTSGAVTNCYAVGSVTGRGNSAGGLVGSLEDSSYSITDSYAMCDVNGYQYTGGLVGISNCTIQNCFTNGTVTSSGKYTGGLVGNTNEIINNCYATCDVNGGYFTGGLVGSTTGPVNKCYATGDVSGSNKVGGLAGISRYNITRSYATGDVSGDEWVGGLVGVAYKIDGSINYKSILASGTVSGSDKTGSLIGGIYNTTDGINFGTINMASTAALSQGDIIGFEGFDNDSGADVPYISGQMSGWLASCTDLIYPVGAIETSLENGQLTIAPNGSHYIRSMSSNLETVLGINSGYGDTYNVNIGTGSTTTDIIAATETTLMSQLGLAQDGIIVNNAGNTVTIATSDSIDSVITKLGTLGITADFTDSILTVGNESDSNFITTISSGVAVALGIEAGDGFSYNSAGGVTATASMTMAELGMQGSTGIIVTDASTITVNSTDTLAEVMDRINHMPETYVTAENAGTRGGVSLEEYAATHNGLLGYVTAIAPEVTVVNAADLESALSTYTTIGIGSSEALAELAKIVNGTDGYSANNCSGKTIVLTTDLDISTICADKTDGEGYGGWDAIGAGSNRFYGVFDGQGHTISGLYINKADKDRQGLFGDTNTIAGCMVRNVILEDADVTGRDYVGAVCGYSNSTKNCSVSGTVNGRDYVGGVSGWISSGSEYTYSSADVTGRNYVGGLFGGKQLNMGTCCATGTVTGEDYVGGLVGSAQTGKTIINSYTTGEVISSGVNAGGIAGNQSEITVKNTSYASGNVTVTSINVLNASLEDGEFTITPNDGHYLQSMSSNLELVFGFNSGYEETYAMEIGGGETLAATGTMTMSQLGLAQNGYIVNNAGNTITVQTTDTIDSVVSKISSLGVTASFTDGSLTVGDAGDSNYITNISSGVSAVLGIEAGSGCSYNVESGVTATASMTMAELGMQGDTGIIVTDWGTITVNSTDTLQEFIDNTHNLIALPDWANSCGGVSVISLEDLAATRSGFITTVVTSTAEVTVTDAATLADAISTYTTIGIGSAEALQQLATLVNSGTSCSGKNIVLTADLDLTSICAAQTVDGVGGWTAIGTEDNNFQGNFNGNGHTISGLYINKSDTGYLGLFGCVDDGTIENVGLEDVDITGFDKIGALVGGGSNVTISNSYATGSVEGSNSFIGGLVGNANCCTISNCHTSVDVTGNNNFTGGLAGLIGNLSVLSGCYATGSVSGRGATGGLVGRSSNSTISDSYAMGDISGTSNVGGLIGYIEGTNTTFNYTYTNMLFAGEISGSVRVGSLVGAVYDTTDGINFATITISNVTVPTGSDIIGFEGKASGYVPYSSGQMEGWLSNVSDISEQYAYSASLEDGKLTITPHDGHYLRAMSSNLELVFGFNSGYEETYSIEIGGGETVVAAGTNTMAELGLTQDGYIVNNAGNTITVQTTDTIDSVVTKIGSLGVTASFTDGTLTVGDAGDSNYITNISSNVSAALVINAGEGSSYASGTVTVSANMTLAELGMNGETGTIVTNQRTITVSATDTIADVINQINAAEMPDWATSVRANAGTTGGVSLDDLAEANNGFIQEVVTIAPEITVVNAADLESALSTYTTIGIGSSEVLAELAKIVNGTDGYTANDCSGKTIVLTTDLDISTICANNTVDGEGGWTAIGTESNIFSGTFDGNGHTISGLYINKADQDYQGLFGIIVESEIKNVGLENVNITAATNTGALVGELWISNITNCYVNGTITGSNNIGGMIGYAIEGTITACNTDATVVGSGNSVGGFLGCSADITITNCYAEGDVTGNNQTGGFLGVNETGTTIINSYTTGNVTGNNYTTGGFLGYNASIITINNCYAAGNVTGNTHVGGFLGQSSVFSSGNNVTITNCYAMGNVTGNGNVGGFAGYANYGTITNCYAAGNVTGDNTVGGFAGHADETTINCCCAAGNVTGNTYIGGIFGKFQQDNGTRTLDQLVSLGSVSGSSKVGSFIGGIFDTTNGSSFSTITITNSSARPQGDMIGFEGRSTGSAYSSGQMSSWLNGISPEVPGISATLSNGNLTVTPGTEEYLQSVSLNLETIFGFNSGYGETYSVNISGGDSHSATNSTTFAELGMLGESGTIVTDIGTITVTPTDTLGHVLAMLSAEHVKEESYTVSANAGTIGGVKLEDLAQANNGFIGEVVTVAPEVTVVNAADLASAISTYTTIGIGSTEALAELATLVNSGTNCSGKTIVLTTDLDLTSYCAAHTNGEGVGGWTSIGDIDHLFRGTFNGNGHKISGLYINDTTSRYVGLFGCCCDASIYDLGLEDVNITASAEECGGLVGTIDTNSNISLTISNCYTTGQIVNNYDSDYTDTGGLIGNCCGNDNLHHAVITNCYSECDVTGNGNNSFTAGLIAYSAWTDITNCYTSGDVYGNNYVFGLVGPADNITNCYTTGNIYGSSGNPDLVYGLCDNNSTVTESSAFGVVSYGETPYFNTSVTNGQVMITPNDGHYILSASPELEAILRLGTGIGDSYGIDIVEETVTTETVSATTATTMSILGLNQDGIIVNNAGNTVTIQTTDTLSSVLTKIRSLSVTASLNNGTLTVGNSGDTNVITNISSNLAVILGIEAGENVSYSAEGGVTATAEMTMAQLGMTGSTGTIVTDVGTLTVSATDTLQDVMDELNGGVSWTADVAATAGTAQTSLRTETTVTRASDLASAIMNSDTIGIANTEVLAELANIVNNGNDCRGKTFVLTGDIDLKSYGEWTAIGTNDRLVFAGDFYGNGYGITGLAIDSKGDYQGLFGYTTGEIHDLAVKGEVKGQNYCGLIAGYSEGLISNCSASGTVNGGRDVGGIAGFAVTIEHSCFEGDVDGLVYVGGLAGEVRGSVNDCYTYAKVKGEFAVGGLVGKSTGDITNSYATGEIRDAEFAGGLAGVIENTDPRIDLEISNVLADITFVNVNEPLGNLIGCIVDNDGGIGYGQIHISNAIAGYNHHMIGAETDTGYRAVDSGQSGTWERNISLMPEGYGVTASLTNGQLTVTPEEGHYLRSVSSNLQSILGLNTGYGESYEITVSDEILETLTITATTATTLSTLGLTSDGVIVTNDGNITVTSGMTISDVIDELSTYSITAGFTGGILSLGDEEDTNYIKTMSANLISALGNISVGEDFSYSVGSHIEEEEVVTPSLETVGMSQTFGDIGITTESVLTLSNGETVTVDSATTFSDFIGDMSDKGMSVSLTNGIFNISSGTPYITGYTGENILNAMNIVGSTYQASDLVLGETKLKDLKDSLGDNLGITSGAITAYKNGIANNIYIDNESTLDELASQLSNYNIQMVYSGGNNGRIYFTSTGDSYLTSAAEGSNLLSALNIESWTEVKDTESNTLQYTTGNDVVINGDTKLVDLKNSSGDSLGITTGKYKLVAAGINYEGTITASTSINDLFTDLARYGFTGSINSDGQITLNTTNDNTYLVKANGAEGYSNIVDTVFSSWTFGNIYVSGGMDVTETETNRITRDTKMIELFGPGKNGWLNVINTQTNEIKRTQIKTTLDNTVGDFMDELSMYGFTSYINYAGQLVISNDGYNTLEYSRGNFDPIESFGLDTSAWEEPGYYTGSAQTATTYSTVLEAATRSTTLANLRDAEGNELGITTGNYLIHSNGVTHTVNLASTDITLDSFMNVLENYGINTIFDTSDGQSVLKIVGGGDSYVESLTGAGASNVINKLFNDVAPSTLYNYSGYQQTTEIVSTTVVATLGTSLSDYGNSEGIFALTVDGNYSEINITSYETFGSLIEKFERAGVQASLTDGVLRLETGNRNFTVDMERTTSNLLTNLGLEFSDNLGGFAASSGSVTQTTTTIEDRTLSVAQYADYDTQMSLLNISSGTLSVYRNGEKKLITIDNTETFGDFRTKLQTAFDNVDIDFIDGKLRFFSTDEGVDVQVGSSNDTSNISSICGFSQNENGYIMSARELYKVNASSKLTTANLFRLGDVTEGTFTIGDATFTIDNNTTMQSLIAQINSSEQANASAYWDSVDGKLVISSRTTGASIVNVEAGTSNFTDILGLTNSEWNPDGSIKTTRIALDSQEIGSNAKFSINGTNFQSASNVITSDVSRIQGLTLNLKSASSGNTVTVNVTQDAEAVTEAVGQFVESYNELVENVEAELSSSGTLKDQSTLRFIKQQIRNLLVNTFGGATTFRNLAALGISTNSGNSTYASDTSTSTIEYLHFDAEKFMEGYTKDAEAVKNMLVGSDSNQGILLQIENIVTNALSSGTGYFASANKSFTDKITSINEKIKKENQAIEAYRARLERQFKSMDMLISQMQNQYSSFLSQGTTTSSSTTSLYGL